MKFYLPENKHYYAITAGPLKKPAAKMGWKYKWSPQASGEYVWILQFTNHDSGKKVEMKGASIQKHINRAACNLI